MLSDDDELIESNSSECSPPRDTQIGRSHEPISAYNNEQIYLKSSQPTAAKFDKLFESFVEANTVKSICKCFKSITDSLNIDSKHIFENG
jgi:hypothetical protein